MDNTKSTFVTVVAWIFIVGSGFATLVSLMQNVMLRVMLKDKDFTQIPENAPAIATFIIENIQLVVLSFFFLCLLTLIASVGLLKRKNWARLVFIGLLTFGALWNLGGIILQSLFFSSAPEMASGPGAEEFQTMHTIIRWFTAIIAVGMAALFAWMIKRLLSSTIKQEFSA